MILLHRVDADFCWKATVVVSSACEPWPRSLRSWFTRRWYVHVVLSHVCLEQEVKLKSLHHLHNRTKNSSDSSKKLSEDKSPSSVRSFLVFFFVVVVYGVFSGLKQWLPNFLVAPSFCRWELFLFLFEDLTSWCNKSNPVWIQDSPAVVTRRRLHPLDFQ